MREALSLSFILMRYGWRSALAKLFNKSQGLPFKILRFLALLYLPFLIIYMNYGVFQRLADPGELWARLTVWKLLPCKSPSCAALMEASQAWPAVPNLVWLGIGLIFLTIVLGIIFVQTTFTKPEVTGRDMEWMRSFPVPMPTILWGRLLQSSCFHPFFSFYLLPFLVIPVYLRGTELAWRLPSAFLLSSMTMLVAMSIGMSVNHYFIFRLEKSSRKTMLSLLSSLIFAATYFVYLGFMIEEKTFWTFMLDVGPLLQASGVLRFMDTFLGQDFPGLRPYGVLVSGALLAAHANVLLAARFMARGVPIQDRTRKSPGASLTKLLEALPTLMSWDLLRFLRNSGQWAFVLLSPIFIVGFLFNDSIAGDSHHRASFYLSTLLILLLIMKGGRFSHQLAADKQVLWLYASTPWRMSELLNQRRKFSWILSVGILLSGLFILVPLKGFQDPSFLIRIDVVCLFIGLHEIHLRSLALTFYNSDTKLNDRPADFILFMGLVPAFVFILVNGEPWTCAAFLLLFTGLVFSKRQMVLSHEDQLLDPTFRFPAAADLSSGFAAALTYALLLFLSSGLSSLFRSLASNDFSIVIAAGMLAALHLSYAVRKASHVPHYSGAIRGLDLMLLIGLGALSVAGTQLWDRMVTAELSVAPSLLILGLIMAARTVTEEFIFRGLIQRGLNPRFGFVLAVILSAFLTTLCHEAQDFGPVFLTSLGAGILYHRTKALWPGILLALGVHLLRASGL